MRRVGVLFFSFAFIKVIGGPILDIKIENESIPKLNQSTFESYNPSDIVEITLINCEIENVTEDAFQKFPKLQMLNLSNNFIQDVKFAITPLLFLDLRNNVLEVAPPLQNFPNLTKMYLNENYINVINYQSENGDLNVLEISKNPLKDLNITLGNLEEIIIKNSQYPNLTLSIDAPNLNLLDTSQILITNRRALCQKPNTTIITDFNAKMIKYRCPGKFEGSILQGGTTTTPMDITITDAAMDIFTTPTPRHEHTLLEENVSNKGTTTENVLSKGDDKTSKKESLPTMKPSPDENKTSTTDTYLLKILIPLIIVLLLISLIVCFCYKKRIVNNIPQESLLELNPEGNGPGEYVDK